MTTTEAQRTKRTQARSTRPNFVFILADDLGFADLHCYGARENISPSLDKLAGEGLWFTNGYANSSVCSPSRFAIATGRYQHRLRGGFDEPIATVTPELGLPPEHPTMASLLRGAGYREPAKFEELRRAYFEWDATMPSRPLDAAIALEYTAETMAKSDG